MQVTIPTEEAKVLLVERIAVLTEMIPTLNEKIQESKERYVQIQTASAWFNRNPKHWEMMWETGNGDSFCIPEKRWDKNLIELGAVQDVIRQINKLIGKLEKMELDGVTEATLGDYEIGLVWYKDAIK